MLFLQYPLTHHHSSIRWALVAERSSNAATLSLASQLVGFALASLDGLSAAQGTSGDIRNGPQGHTHTAQTTQHTHSLSLSLTHAKHRCTRPHISQHIHTGGSGSRSGWPPPAAVDSRPIAASNGFTSLAISCKHPAYNTIRSSNREPTRFYIFSFGERCAARPLFKMQGGKVD